ncbi:hypothetical protein SHIRM173S_00023 [Streptomyces hirsutus]
MAVAHEPAAAREVDGPVPLVLAGHVHRQKTEVMKYGTRLRIEGSTGGSGLRAIEGEHPDPIRTSILYFDRDTRRLQAWDAIRLGGLGLTTAEVSRHLPEENQPGASRSVPPVLHPALRRGHPQLTCRFPFRLPFPAVVPAAPTRLPSPTSSAPVP